MFLSTALLLILEWLLLLMMAIRIPLNPTLSTFSSPLSAILHPFSQFLPPFHPPFFLHPFLPSSLTSFLSVFFLSGHYLCYSPFTAQFILLSSPSLSLLLTPKTIFFCFSPPYKGPDRGGTDRRETLGKETEEPKGGKMSLIFRPWGPQPMYHG